MIRKCVFCERPLYKTGLFIAVPCCRILCKHIELYLICSCYIKRIPQCKLQHLSAMTLSPLCRVNNYELQKSFVVFYIDGITEKADHRSIIPGCYIGTVRPLFSISLQQTAEALSRHGIRDEPGTPQGVNLLIVDPSFNIFIISGFNIGSDSHCSYPLLKNTCSFTSRYHMDR